MKTVLNVKTDKEVKERAQEIAKQLGLPLSTVVNAYLKEFVRDRAVRFSLQPQLRPNCEKLLKTASEDFRKGRNISQEYTTAEEALRYLHSR